MLGSRTVGSVFRFAVGLAVAVTALLLLAGLPANAAHPSAPTAPLRIGPASRAPATVGDLAPVASSNGRWYNLTGGLNPAPSTRFGGEMAYDAKDGYLLLYGGTNASEYPFIDTWTYENGAWTQVFPTVSPSARIAEVMVYDPVDQCVVLFGGINIGTDAFLGDTWEYAGGVWTNVTSGTGPAARADASAEWDPDLQSIVLFGGQNSSGAFGDTWRFVGGTWTEIYPASSPSPRVASALTYDAADGYLLLFGGASLSGNYADTYKFANGTWTELFPAAAPTGRAVWQSVYDTALGAVLLFGGGVGNDSVYFGDTWTYHAGQWTEQFPTGSPSARQFGPMAWDPLDDYAFTFGGQSHESNGTVYYLDDSWVYVTAPAVTIAPVSNAHDIGQTVSLSVDIIGGVPPYTVAWTYGDATSGAGMSTTHAYGSAGAYTVAANVTDAFEQSGTGTRSVLIYAAPTVSVSVNASSTVTGKNVTITATVTGGAPPISYAWSFGNGRTATGAGPFVVAYNASGAVIINVTVTDAAGKQASGIASLTVTAPPPAKSSGALNGWLWVGLVIVVVAVVVAAVVLVGRRRKPPSPPLGASGPTGWTPPPPPPARP